LNPQFEAKTKEKGQYFIAAPSGAGDAFYLEPLLAQFLSHFNRLMEVYQTQQKDE